MAASRGTVGGAPQRRIGDRGRLFPPTLIAIDTRLGVVERLEADFQGGRIGPQVEVEMPGIDKLRIGYL